MTAHNPSAPHPSAVRAFGERNTCDEPHLHANPTNTTTTAITIHRDRSRHSGRLLVVAPFKSNRHFYYENTQTSRSMLRGENTVEASGLVDRTAKAHPMLLLRGLVSYLDRLESLWWAHQASAKKGRPKIKLAQVSNRMPLEFKDKPAFFSVLHRLRNQSKLLVR